ncbi:MAG: tetratricopeptide repeat protein, partial [candidate division Zixibacteria bacterium]|nr:tetratricopeptide repeat protein [candidate division Zixibacteria bacterium]
RVPLVGAVKPESVAMIFCVAWLVSGVFGLMPFFYRPMRYGLFLFLPMAAISAFAVRESLTAKARAMLHNRWISLPLIFAVSWHTFTQVFIFFSPVGNKFDAGTRAMFTTAVLAAAVTGVVFLMLQKRSRNLPRAALTAAFAVLLLAAAVYQGRYCYNGLTQPGSYLKQYNTELAQIVDNAAVLTGPYTPALTIDNELRGIIYMFGLSNVQKDLFDRFPITHVVTDRGNWKRAVEDFPALKSCTGIVQMVVRELVVDLYRLPGAAVPLTDFERGVIHLVEKQPDSAHFYFNRFSNDYPQNLLGRIHLALALLESGQALQAITLVRELLDRHPDNYMLHGFCRGFYLRVYKATGDDQYQRLSEHHDRIATQLNPVMAKGR